MANTFKQRLEEVATGGTVNIWDVGRQVVHFKDMGLTSRIRCSCEVYDDFAMRFTAGSGSLLLAYQGGGATGADLG